MALRFVLSPKNIALPFLKGAINPALNGYLQRSFKFLQASSALFRSELFLSQSQWIQNVLSYRSLIQLPEKELLEDAVLNVNTHRRKRTKLKKSKRKQRRKKLRRLSERKKKKLNL